MASRCPWETLGGRLLDRPEAMVMALAQEAGWRALGFLVGLYTPSGLFRDFYVAPGSSR